MTQGNGSEPAFSLIPFQYLKETASGLLYPPLKSWPIVSKCSNATEINNAMPNTSEKCLF